MKGKKITIYLFFTTLFLYGNTLLNGWGLDDNFVLKDNSQVMKGVSGLSEIFTSPYYSGPGASFGYRPMTKAMFAIEYSIFGINLPVHHLINLILYFICGILVYRILKRYLQESYGDLFVITATFIWLFHPAHTEVVASLKNREEMLWMIFAFLFIEHLEKYIDRSRIVFLFTSLVFIVLSYFSKQSALSVLLLLPLLFWYKYGSLPKPDFKSKITRLIITSVAIIITGIILYKITYILFRKDTIELTYTENPLRFSGGFTNILSLSLYTVMSYIRIFFIPHPLVFYYGLYHIPELSLFSLPVIFSFIIVISLLTIFISGLKKRTSISFGAGFFILSIFMFSNLPEKVNGIVGERLLFVPSIGLAVFFTALLFYIFKLSKTDKLKELPAAFKTIFIVILFLFGGKTILRNTSWKDSLVLYRNDIRYNSNSVQANTILAGEMMDRVLVKIQKGRPITDFISSTDSIIMLYRRALTLYPNSYRVMNNLGDLYMTFKNDPDTALLFLTGAYNLEPANFYVNYNIARGFEMKGDYKKSVIFYKNALTAKPEKTEAAESVKRVQKEIEKGAR